MPGFHVALPFPKRDTEETTEYRQAAVNRSETTLVKTMRCFPVSRRQNSRIRLSARFKTAGFPLIVPPPYIPVLQYGELLDDEPVGIVVRTPRILERTGGDKASLGHVALTDDQLPGVCTRLVGIGGKVAHHAVHVYHLVDVARNQPVVISLFGKVHIVVIGALVRQLQGTAYIVLDRVLLRESEKNSS